MVEIGISQITKCDNSLIGFQNQITYFIFSNSVEDNGIQRML